MSFHVPESTRRRDGPMPWASGTGNNGCFEMASMMPGRHLLMIASDGQGWEHVSVHVEDAKGRAKIPLWEEMCSIKNIFWDADDCVVQFHPPESDYVNVHKTVLHLWRPQGVDLPRPPSFLV